MAAREAILANPVVWVIFLLTRIRPAQSVPAASIWVMLNRRSVTLVLEVSVQPRRQAQRAPHALRANMPSKLRSTESMVAKRAPPAMSLQMSKVFALFAMTQNIKMKTIVLLRPAKFAQPEDIESTLIVSANHVLQGSTERGGARALNAKSASMRPCLARTLARFVQRAVTKVPQGCTLNARLAIKVGLLRVRPRRNV